MTAPRDNLRPARAPTAAGWPRVFHVSHNSAAKKEKRPWGSVQPIEKARFGQENPRKSKPFFFDFFGWIWLGFVGFG
jgi:hypothetical protein